MEQKKIGSFLKELRKGKNLSQEQLAEILNVTGRTVSRWETGTNMPDISILVELAEFYEVSIPELIEGGRKNYSMKEEVKETVLKVADYEAFKDQNVRYSLFMFTLIALIGISAFAVVEIFDLAKINSTYQDIASAGLSVSIAFLVGMVIYLSGIFNKSKKKKNY